VRRWRQIRWGRRRVGRAFYPDCRLVSARTNDLSPKLKRCEAGTYLVLDLRR
jgi:hypothetical protein